MQQWYVEMSIHNLGALLLLETMMNNFNRRIFNVIYIMWLKRNSQVD